jgi:Cys-tRNA(Pro) deacylase
MSRPDYPITPAVRALRAADVEFEPLIYRYVEHGGTSVSSAELGWPEHAVIKTLVMQRDDKQGIVVLMHGDCEVSVRNLARMIGARTVTPCQPKDAERLTGYQVGGISPFGTKTKMPVYIESTILELPRIAINGGKRGFLISIAPNDVARVLAPVPVQVAVR